jgi:L-aminopeptidase/D-esterase-like protein
LPNDTITAIAGVSVGHWTQTEGGTGCTVILFDPPVVAGVDVRGSAPERVKPTPSRPSA